MGVLATNDGTMKSEYTASLALTPANKDKRSFKQRLQHRLVGPQYVVSEHYTPTKVKRNVH